MSDEGPLVWWSRVSRCLGPVEFKRRGKDSKNRKGKKDLASKKLPQIELCVHYAIGGVPKLSLTSKL